jgi:hypothetical protein
LEEVWKEDVDMYDRPLVIHCSGLGGGLLSPDHDYDLFFQNQAQMKVYGPSLVMIDNWELRVSQLGLTKTTHEYAIYQLLATARGWSMWKKFLPIQFVHPKLLLLLVQYDSYEQPQFDQHMRDHHTLPGLQQYGKSSDVIIPRERFCCYKPATRT